MQRECVSPLPTRYIFRIIFSDNLTVIGVCQDTGASAGPQLVLLTRAREGGWLAESYSSRLWSSDAQSALNMSID